MARFLVVVNSRGNAEGHRRPLLEHLVAAGHDVHLAGPFARVDIEGITVHQLKLDRRGVNPIQELETLLELRRIIRGVSPHIVHAFTIKPVIYSGLVAPRSVKLVQSITGLGYAFTATGRRARLVGAVVRQLYRRALARATVIFQNRDDARLFRELGLVADMQSRVIPGAGVDVDRWGKVDAPDGFHTFGFVGRFIEDKGILDFVHAARQTPQARCVLVGDVDAGNAASIATEQVASWVEEGVVEDWGWRSPEDFLPKLDAVVLPSWREGVPLALLEAGAAGRLIITTDAPGCRDVAMDGAGMIVQVRNPEALGNAMAAAMAKPRAHRAIAEEGRRRMASHFSQAAVLGQHDAVYRELLNA